MSVNTFKVRMNHYFIPLPSLALAYILYPTPVQKKRRLRHRVHVVWQAEVQYLPGPSGNTVRMQSNDVNCN